MAETPIRGVPAVTPKAQPATPAPAAPAQPAAPAAPAPQAPQAPAPEPQAPAPQATPPEPQVSNRTQEQIDKLTESNQQLFKANELLRQELQRRAQSNQQFTPSNASQPAPTAQPTASGQLSQPEDFIEVDPVSGERVINESKFRQEVSRIREQATQAHQQVQNYIQTAEQREIDRQNREAWSAYPELNSGSATFDPRFNQLARAAIYDSMINPSDYGGRPLSYKEAADFIRGNTGRPTQVVPQAQPQVDPAVVAQQQTAKDQ